MEDTRSTSPSVGKPSLRLDQAFQLARERLSRVKDAAEICRNSGAKCLDTTEGKSIVVEYLNRAYTVSVPKAKVDSIEGGEPISAREQLLILHYLLSAKGTPPANKLITFQELPEGQVYYSTFLKRAVQPMVTNFGKDPALLLTLVERIGGIKGEAGDVSFTFNAFPKVPLTFVLWRGDDEFEARGNFLFDAGISDYLPTEDITVLCEIVCWNLVKARSL